MASLLFPTVKPLSCSKIGALTRRRTPTLFTSLGSSTRAFKHSLRFPFFTTLSLSTNQSISNGNEEQEEQDLVQDLRVPKHWLIPSNALQESEWLKATLHKWLDDEYCVEDTNIEISDVAAKSYYESLIVKKETDLGKILLKMAKDLESISYQESFHGAFTSANAAVHLISQKIEQE